MSLAAATDTTQIGQCCIALYVSRASDLQGGSLPRTALVVLAVLLLVGFVAAQSSDRIEVFGGYSYTRPDFSLVSPNDANGWNASADFKARRWIGFAVDVSGFYPSYAYPEESSVSGKTYTFLFGPQVTVPLGRFAPFGRFLIGFSHVTTPNFGGYSANILQSNNAFTLGSGGGLDYRVARHIAIRGQVDWLYALFRPSEDPGPTYVTNRNVARISTGVVFRF
jgi:opacity protein-like surface antigen